MTSSFSCNMRSSLEVPDENKSVPKEEELKFKNRVFAENCANEDEDEVSRESDWIIKYSMMVR